MRRSEREMTDPSFMFDVLERTNVLFLSLNTGGAPYVFGVSPFLCQQELYFHCAGEGRKIDLMKRDPRVGFSAAIDIAVEKKTMRYRSVCGTGVLEIVEDADLKNKALQALAKKFRAPCKFPVSEAKFAATTIARIVPAISRSQALPKIMSTSVPASLRRNSLASCTAERVNDSSPTMFRIIS